MRSAQALLEYVLSLAAIAVLAGVLWVFIDAAFHFSDRAERVVSCDYP